MPAFITKLKQFFSGYSTQTSAPVKKSCPFCGGGRCMGMCGNSLAKLTKVNVQGIVRLGDASLGVIEDDGEALLTFNAEERFGRMILKKCPVGSRCTVEALAQGKHMEKLIFVKKG